MIDETDDGDAWCLPGARVAPPIPGAEAFSTSPLLTHLRAAAAADPKATALVGQSNSIQYGDMLRLAQNTAHAVANLAPPGRPVACLLPCTPEGITGLLGCLISGRLCLVLDPAMPPERLAALLADAVPAVILAAAPLKHPPAAPVLMLDTVLASSDADWRMGPDWNPDSPLAVHFTSGSSGRPKGIVLSSRSVLYRALDTNTAWGLTSADRVFCPSMPFAGSGLACLLGALSRGARVVLADLATEGAGAVLRLLEWEAVTCAMIQPPALRLLSSLERARTSFRALRALRSGASALTRADIAAWRLLLPPGCEILHTYASTEALIIAQWTLPADDRGPETTVAAGLRQALHEYALVGEDGRPAPPGEPGELVLRSRYLALGEWREGRLVPGAMRPVPGRSGWRFFRTGDLMLVQPDGMLRVLGRADRQVKINGVRVEPAEIEAVLRAEPAVTDAVVVARTVSGSVTLHGFVAATVEDRLELIRALRQRLSAALPMALRPADLTVLDRLPALPSGKIDLNALSRWDAAR